MEQAREKARVDQTVIHRVIRTEAMEIGIEAKVELCKETTLPRETVIKKSWMSFQSKNKLYQIISINIVIDN